MPFSTLLGYIWQSVSIAGGCIPATFRYKHTDNYISLDSNPNHSGEGRVVSKRDALASTIGHGGTSRVNK